VSGEVVSWAPQDSAAGDGALHRPIRARFAVVLWAMALGLVFLFALGLPLTYHFFVLAWGWFAIAAGVFRWLAEREGSAFFFSARFFLFGFEVVVAAWVAHYFGASSWLATLFLLLPAIEWNMLYPGAWGLAGSFLAVLATGALILGEALGFVPSSTLFPAIEPGYAQPTYGFGAFLLSASIIVGLSTVVSRYAEAGRRKSRELTDANERLREMSTDVTRSHADLEAAYEQLRNAQAELVGSAKLATLGNLIAGVAHEINTPLGALHSNHYTIARALARLQEILEDEVVDEDELEDVRRIVKAIDGVTSTNNMAVDRMVKLVDSLRTFGRVDRSEIDYADLHEGLESTLAILSHEIRDRIDVIREYGDLPPVECYPNQIHQVFMNIIVNAIQAITDSGTITVRTRHDEDEVVVEIQDTGVGMSEDTMARIFDPGFTTKGSRMGMGMGLLITNRIVDRHSGRLHVESEPGVGTTFSVRLPVRLPTEPGREREPSRRQPAPDGAV
jgi:two-component system NtrC family sensor kinase